MSAPQISPQINLPNDTDIPMTYDELLETLSCICSGGAIIKPGSIPSATINIGDIIADFAKPLSIFTSIYGIIAVILKVIACIIDVICALTNPIALIKAIIRLFGTCLPDLILIFPVFAIPAIIICLIKIILAIIEYITTVIIPIIQDIIQNIQDLYDAFAKNNQDAQLAVAFKIASMFKELFNIFGILEALAPIIDMIKAILNFRIGLPCRGGGGSCDECGEDQCPTLIQESEVTGSDGIIYNVFYGDSAYDTFFNSPLRAADFIALKDFFPNINYDEIDDLDDVPYKLTVESNEYIAKSVDSSGNIKLQQVLPSLADDGYLNSTPPDGSFPNPSTDYHFGTATSSFASSSLNKYITINDSNQGSVNNGNWQIVEVYDGYNVALRRIDGVSWTSSNKVYWRLTPTIPVVGGNQEWTLEINHDELLRNDMIGAGCHPAIKAEIDGLENRYPQLENNIPDLPDIDGFQQSLFNILPVGKDVDVQHILDNYDNLDLGNLNDDINTLLDSFRDEIIDYTGDIYPQIFDPERTAETFIVTPEIQTIGFNSTVSLTLYDRSGDILGKGFTDDIFEVELSSSSGTLSEVTPIYENGVLTGQYTATLTSDIEETIEITAIVGGTEVADFIGNEMVQKVVSATFVSARIDTIDKTGPDPLGK
jgi:hypothetical protein